MSDRDIIVFTQFYPFTLYDGYFHFEIQELSRYYRKIILVSASKSGERFHDIPPQASECRFVPGGGWWMKIRSLRWLFSRPFFIELKQSRLLRRKKRLQIILLILSSLERASRYRKFLRRTIREHRLDASRLTVYCHWFLDYVYAACSLRSVYPAVKIATRAHSYDLYFYRSPIQYLALKRQSFRSLDLLCPVSENGRQYFIKEHNISGAGAGKIKVARLGVMPARNPRLKHTGQSMLRVVSNAFISPNKRIELIAEALSGLEGHQVEWVHFGNIYRKPEAFQEFRERIQEQLSHCPHVTVLFKGGVPNPEVLEYYNTHFVDLLINVSQSEGVPVSIMEAFAAGIPAVATDTGGCGEIVQEQNGWLMNVNLTAGDLRKVIETYANLSPAQKESYRRHAFETWESKYNATRNYPEFVKMLYEL